MSPWSQVQENQSSRRDVQTGLLKEQMKKRVVAIFFKHLYCLKKTHQINSKPKGGDCSSLIKLKKRKLLIHQTRRCVSTCRSRLWSDSCLGPLEELPPDTPDQSDTPSPPLTTWKRPKLKKKVKEIIPKIMNYVQVTGNYYMMPKNQSPQTKRTSGVVSPDCYCDWHCG